MAPWIGCHPRPSKQAAEFVLRADAAPNASLLPLLRLLNLSGPCSKALLLMAGHGLPFRMRTSRSSVYSWEHLPPSTPLFRLGRRRLLLAGVHCVCDT